MNLSCKIILPVIILLVLSNVAAAGKGDGDRWFGKDKFLHFGYSSFFSAGASLIADRHFHNGERNSFFIGFGFTVSLGTAKEVFDYKTPGQTCSYKDLIWDIAGALAGAAIASYAL